MEISYFMDNIPWIIPCLLFGVPFALCALAWLLYFCEVFFGGKEVRRKPELWSFLNIFSKDPRRLHRKYTAPEMKEDGNMHLVTKYKSKFIYGVDANLTELIYKLAVTCATLSAVLFFIQLFPMVFLGSLIFIAVCLACRPLS